MPEQQGPQGSGTSGQVSVQMVGIGPAVIGHIVVGAGQEATGHLAGNIPPPTPYGFAGSVGVYGNSTSGIGVLGISKATDGVQGRSYDAKHSGVAGVNDGGGAGVYGRGVPAGHFDGKLVTNGDCALNGNVAVSGILTAGAGAGQLAAHFNGNVEIDGDLTVLNGKDIKLADFAEDFDLASEQEAGPGSVVVLDAEGAVRQSQSAYDKKVAGVVSGAGNFRPAITLDRERSTENRTPVALVGKVYCKVDSRYGAIEVGDMLTTSPTPGHAMKAVDRERAFGAVIGKALRPLAEGQGLIPILIALQ